MSAFDSNDSELWRRYRHENDASAHERLFQAHAQWAISIARSIHRRVWAYPIDREDFAQNATIGLLEAMSRFEPERGIPFRAFAKARVRGAVFNGLKAIIGERSSHQSENLRYPARLEDLQECSSGDALEGLIDTIVGLGMGYMLEDLGQGDSDRATQDGFSFAHNAQLRSRLLVAVGSLSVRRRLVIETHYFRFIPFHEIAGRLGVTKGRVSQLHHAALAELRDHLREP